MSGDSGKNDLRDERDRWARETLDPILERAPERLPPERFTTVSTFPMPRLATQLDLPGMDFSRDIGCPWPAAGDRTPDAR